MEVHVSSVRGIYKTRLDKGCKLGAGWECQCPGETGMLSASPRLGCARCRPGGDRQFLLDNWHALLWSSACLPSVVTSRQAARWGVAVSLGGREWRARCLSPAWHGALPLPEVAGEL